MHCSTTAIITATEITQILLFQSTKLIYMFRLIDRSLCPMGSLHAMNYFVSFGDFYTSGRQDAEAAKSLITIGPPINNQWIIIIMQFLSCNISSSKLSLNFFLHSYSSIVHTVEPVLSGTVLSGHPLLSGQLSKSRKLLLLMYCNFDLY